MWRVADVELAGAVIYHITVALKLGIGLAQTGKDNQINQITNNCKIKNDCGQDLNVLAKITHWPKGG